MSAPLLALRWLLGLIMTVTALDYFLPQAVPWVSQASWHDPMTLRLLGAFEASGLLAVAKFIQLAGGALLLFNRAVPFALAAMVCVNVCAAFVALLIEGSALFGLIALSLLALNVLLMVAYLPAYAGVLAPGSLADGEGEEDGTNYNSLFVNPLGKASWPQLLVALALLLAALAFYRFVVPFANGPTGLVVLILPSLVLGFALVRKATEGKATPRD